MMKRLIILLFALALCAGCAEKWEWSVPLSVNSTDVKIPKNLAGHIYFPIYSTVTWDLTFEYGESDPEWLHPDRTSGKGYNVCVRIEYDANPNPVQREAYLVITPRSTSSGAETIRVHLTQPATL